MDAFAFLSLSVSGKWKRCRGEINSAKSIFPLETDSFLLREKETSERYSGSLPR